MQGQFYDDVMEGIQGEVAEEFHGTAKFMTKNVVSNVDEGSVA